METTGHISIKWKKNLGMLEELSEKMQGELNSLRDRLEEMEWALDAKLEESKRKEEEAKANREQEVERRKAEIKEVEE